MELNVQDWKEFNIARLCYVDMGNKFDNDKMTYEQPSINFVSRTANNNGVSDIVDKISGVTPYPANSVTVALGGSIGSCYLQTKPFYTGQNVSVLLFNDDVPNNAKLFITTMFMNECKYKYVAFGRELNVHIRNDFTLYLPIKHNKDNTPTIDENKTYSDEGYIPDWQFMEDYIKSLHHKPITTKVKAGNVKDLDVDNWEEFKVSDLFNKIYKAKAHTKEEVVEVDKGIHFVSRTDCNNGVDITVDKDTRYEGLEEANCITIGDTTATVFYQNEKFIAGDHMVVLRADWLNLKRGLFFRTLFAQEGIRYCYGRAYRMDLIKDTLLKLPIKRDGNGNPVIDDNRTYSAKGYIPDWQFMEDYINSLPYSDRI